MSARSEGDGAPRYLATEGTRPSPSTPLVDADSPHAGHEITRAFDGGYAMVLVSADGRERIITAKMPAASR